MRNTFINGYRKGQKSKTYLNRSGKSDCLNVGDPHTFSSPETLYEWRDLWQKINSLKKDLAVPFKLHASGYKYYEIAEQLKVPVGTVKNRIFKARKLIQKKLV
jgi:RNA polymerase sigma-70 factor (ECF subfamily)